MSKQHDEINWLEQLSQLETWVVQGRHAECREFLQTLNPKKIPDQWRLQFAQISWRANDYLFVLKSLQSVIYPENRFQKKALDQEVVTYAGALSSLGATHEAIRLLNEIDGANEPSALLHLAGAHIQNWDYEDAQPCLKEYIQSNKITDYQRLVGKVNWAATLVHLEKWPDAVELLKDIQKICEQNSYQLLLGNCFELRAQVEIIQGRYLEGRQLLSKALEYLKGQAGNYSMYAEKWLAVCDCRENLSESMRKQGLQKLRDVRKQALELRHWNTVRECDLFEALALDDQNLLRKVIMGTPSETYRHRARKFSGATIVFRGKFEFYLGSQTEHQFAVFDPHQRTSEGDALFKKPLLYTLFQALIADLYQPQTLGMLFQVLYANEKFNPFTSPARVLQLLRRLNDWFATNKLPLEVEFVKSEFKLSSTQKIRIQVTRGGQKNAQKAQLSEIKNFYRAQNFSIQDLCRDFEISKATAERLLRKANDLGVLAKDRKPWGVAYRFQVAAKKKTAA